VSAPTGPEIPAVGAILSDADGRILLVQRGNEPDRGRWSLPGGRVEPDEEPAQAVVREMREETGLEVHVVEHVGRIERPRPDGGRYLIDDFRVEVVGGRLGAATDALAVAWFGPEELAGVETTPDLVEALTRWGVLADTAT
jgi:ADP-ribose pyrophosphatase YjhB (NUDIX family)